MEEERDETLVEERYNVLVCVYLVTLAEASEVMEPGADA